MNIDLAAEKVRWSSEFKNWEQFSLVDAEMATGDCPRQDVQMNQN